jgi:hypothetical protein
MDPLFPPHPTPKEKEKKTTTIYKILAIRLQLPMKKTPYNNSDLFLLSTNDERKKNASRHCHPSC